MRVGQWPGLYARPRRPTVDGAPPSVHLHTLYAGGIRAGPPLTGRRTRYISMTLTFAALYTLRATPRPAMPQTLPKLASGPTGATHPARHPAPSPATHVAFLFIGLAGVFLQLTCRDNSAAFFSTTYRIIVVLS